MAWLMDDEKTYNTNLWWVNGDSSWEGHFDCIKKAKTACLEAIDDHEDIKDAEAVLADGSEPIPWDEMELARRSDSWNEARDRIIKWTGTLNGTDHPLKCVADYVSYLEAGVSNSRLTLGGRMSDNRTLQEQCYGECWAAQQRIEELEHELVAANNNIKRLEDIVHRAACIEDIERVNALEEADKPKRSVILRGKMFGTDHVEYCETVAQAALGAYWAIEWNDFMPCEIEAEGKIVWKSDMISKGEYPTLVSLAGIEEES
jgi:hypothetical protein